MPKNIHAMVDLETLSLASNASIISIGAVLWDIETGEIKRRFYANVDPTQKFSEGLDINPGTVMWWLQQSDQARGAFLEHTPVNLKAALIELGLFIPQKTKVWSHATFDSVVLSNAYKQLGLATSWSFRDVMDIRTLTSLFKALGKADHNELPQRPEKLVLHNALADAEWQAHYVTYMYNDIRSSTGCQV